MDFLRTTGGTYSPWQSQKYFSLSLFIRAVLFSCCLGPKEVCVDACLVKTSNNKPNIAKYLQCVEVDKAAVGLQFISRYRMRLGYESYGSCFESAHPVLHVEQPLFKLHLYPKYRAQLVLTLVRVSEYKAVVKGILQQKLDFEC